MKSINILLSLRFPLKLIYCIAFGIESSVCCLPKSTAIILPFFKQL